MCESFFPERDEDPISSRLGVSLTCWRRRVGLSSCNWDVGESGSGRFELCVVGGLSPSELEIRSSPSLEIASGGLRCLVPCGPPNGLAVRSGIIFFVVCDCAAAGFVVGSLRADASSLCFEGRCLPRLVDDCRYAALSGSLELVRCVGLISRELEVLSLDCLAVRKDPLSEAASSSREDRIMGSEPGRALECRSLVSNMYSLL